MSQVSVSPHNEGPASDPNIAASPAQTNPPHGLMEFWTYFRQNRGAVFGLLVVLALVLCALFAEIVAPHSAIEQFRDFTLVPPAWQ
ncbi:MAG TPA: dipeptide ABC transporter permease DppC, partial [Undibacterium sp.]|nr:dipeptide ABC transporter permease DppC [Undibacterium sp.]